MFSEKISEGKVKGILNTLVVLGASFLLLSCQALQKNQTDFVIVAVVEGLMEGDKASIEIVPNVEEPAIQYPENSSSFLAKIVTNGEYAIELGAISDGIYKITITAEDTYYHEPKGYIFAVAGEQIIRKQDNRFHFALIPPSQQSLPPCREVMDKTSVAEKTEEVMIETEQGTVISEVVTVSCRAEYWADVSSPPKQGEQP